MPFRGSCWVRCFETAIPSDQMIVYWSRSLKSLSMFFKDKPYFQIGSSPQGTEATQGNVSVYSFFLASSRAESNFRKSLSAPLFPISENLLRLISTVIPTTKKVRFFGFYKLSGEQIRSSSTFSSAASSLSGLSICFRCSKRLDLRIWWKGSDLPQ